MARKTLTDTALRALPPGEHADPLRPGLSVRVGASGVRSFALRYYLRGRQRRMRLGQYGQISLADARERARQVLDLASRGIDPAARQRRTPAEELTFAQLSEQYLELYAQRKKRSWREDERILRVDVLPHWGDLPAREIQRSDVHQLLDGIVDRGAPIMANRSLAVLRKLFNWAVGRELVPHSPCHMVERPAQERRLRRNLSFDEIIELWSLLEREDWAIATPFRMILATAQRPGEVLQSKLAEYRLPQRLWSIPPERHKAKRLQLVPLSDLVLALIASRPHTMPADSPLLFPSPRTDREMDTGTLGHAARRISRHLGWQFTPRDLRRTAAERMRDLGVTRAEVTLVLGHAVPGVTAHYINDPREGLREKRRALDLWGRHLHSLIPTKGC